MDAIFDSSGNVAGNSGGNRLTAWTGQGLVNLLAPSTSGIASAGSLLPADSEMGRAIRQATRYSYPANINNYAKIMADADARAAQQQAATNLFNSDTQSVLQQYINAITSGNLGAVTNRDAVNEALSQYQTIRQAAQAQRDEQNLNTLRNTQNGTGGSIKDALNAYNSLTAGAGPTETRNFANQAANAGIDRNSLLAMDALNRSMNKKYGFNWK